MTKQEAYRLAGESGCAHTTVERWAAGGKVKPSTDYALRRACEVLGFELPSPLEHDQATGTDGG